MLINLLKNSSTKSFLPTYLKSTAIHTLIISPLALAKNVGYKHWLTCRPLLEDRYGNGHRLCQNKRPACQNNSRTELFIKVKKKYKVFKLSRGLEKNSVLQKEDIKVLYSNISSQSSFFKNKN